ncbi:aromatic acid/H+ symport family MFS transporter [Klugiella xanthotipulae]|uniref:AAHS family benzoate transporter-like MFS transporter n=1 Tax=Klugiella xanthotipulae TaxID=244735 RepID=A0A543I766_9MICO|nr:aromatic acid/H+ symport family MFS transporter [Klugiella xanthotipulae]TQM66395.1 AAHS family benzoate transporter-like MFS transporter [Klugiella xanthotipulae]
MATTLSTPSASSERSAHPAPARRSGLTVLILCFVTIIFDGYDLVVFGSTVPAILEYPAWSVDAALAGSIGSLALVGMLLGTLTVGVLTDRLGRRRIMLGCIAWFSLCMLLTFFAPTVEIFAVLRFLTGLGLGGVVPTCIAMTVEFAPKSRRQIANAVMFSGYSVGGVIAAIVAMNFLAHVDFRWLYLVGALPLVTLLPVVWKLLPESIAYTAARGDTEAARRTAGRYGLVYTDIVAEAPVRDGAVEASSSAAPTKAGSSLRELFTRRWILATILFALANFCGLLLVYGLNTWLPQIMRTAGYELGGALGFLLMLNLGAIVGAISASWVADRIGGQRVVITCFILACASIFLLSLNLPMAALYALVAVAGLGSVGTQILIGGFCATYFPVRLNATALAWSLGVGRIGAITGPIIGGVIASLLLGYQVNFYVFAGVAVLGAAVIALVPRASRS